AKRSIATDSRVFPKGALCFIETQEPIINENKEIIDWVDFSRFVLNQDTGGAIKGPGRVDIFMGNGVEAEVTAGHLQHRGDLYFLVLKPD
ncbi:MAG: murein transglycosylase, partial [Proteobacteria bacterium]|nr:murein transglycosylase [Pseudomonadota bacterium]